MRRLLKQLGKKDKVRKVEERKYERQRWSISRVKNAEGYLFSKGKETEGMCK